MANSTPTDPIAMWRDFVAQWEKSVNQLSNQTMGTSEFSGTMNKAAGLSYALQQTMADMVSRYQTAANMPTRADIAAIGERLIVIESTLNRVAAMIERMPNAGEAPAAARTTLPPRTRKPPSRTAAAAPTAAPASAATAPESASKGERS